MKYGFIATKKGEKMNGYTIMAESYKVLAEQGKIEAEKAEKAIRIFDFLATCDNDDLCQMVDSSAFNDIIKAFLRMAVRKAAIEQDAKEKVLEQIYFIFDEKQAKEVLANE